MPIFAYLKWVGPVLLTMLFVADYVLPRPELRDQQFSYIIPIEARKAGPDPVAFNGQTLVLESAEKAAAVLLATAVDRISGAFTELDKAVLNAHAQIPAEVVQQTRTKLSLRRPRHYPGAPHPGNTASFADRLGNLWPGEDAEPKTVGSSN